jgi:hypothetical protein
MQTIRKIYLAALLASALASCLEPAAIAPPDAYIRNPEVKPGEIRLLAGPTSITLQTKNRKAL